MVVRKTAWTRAARATIERARAWAGQHGNGRVAARHVLIALVERADPQAQRLRERVAGVERLAHALANLRGSSDVDGGTLSGIHDVPLTPSGRALLQRAIDAAAHTRGAVVEPEHLWRALASSDDRELRWLLGFVSSNTEALHSALRAPQPAPQPSEAVEPTQGADARAAGADARACSAAAPDGTRRAEAERVEPGLLPGAAGVRRAKLAADELSDEELLKVATLVFAESGGPGVAAFVRGLGREPRLRLARLLERQGLLHLDAVEHGAVEQGSGEPAAEALAPALELTQAPQEPDPPVSAPDLSISGPTTGARDPQAEPPPSLWGRLAGILLPTRPPPSE